MATSTPTLDLACEYGGVSIGENTARLGIHCNREQLDIDRADDAFCNRRLTGCVVLGHAEDAGGQIKLIEGTDHVVQGNFDVTGLTFSLNDIDVSELALFSKGSGRLLVDMIADIPDDEEVAPDHIPGTLRSEGPWADVSLDTLFDPKQVIRKSLAAAGLNTVGQLADYTATEKRLTDIGGIGKSKVQLIEDRLIDFFADNPDAGNEGSSGNTNPPA